MSQCTLEAACRYESYWWKASTVTNFHHVLRCDHFLFMVSNVFAGQALLLRVVCPECFISSINVSLHVLISGLSQVTIHSDSAIE